MLASRGAALLGTVAVLLWALLSLYVKLMVRAIFEGTNRARVLLGVGFWMLGMIAVWLSIGLLKLPAFDGYDDTPSRQIFTSSWLMPVTVAGVVLFVRRWRRGP